MSENKSTGIITAKNLKELKDHCKKQSESERLGYEHRLVLEIIYKYESLIYEIKNLENRIKYLEAENLSYRANNDELIKKQDNFKCCGNCKSRISSVSTSGLYTPPCPYFNSDLPNGWSGYCSSWQFDSLTQKERVIE